MWLPTPVYKRIPQFYFLLGLLFMANGLYISFEYPIAFAYFGFGMWCSALGVGIFVIRKVRRAAPASVDATEESVHENATPVT